MIIIIIGIIVFIVLSLVLFYERGIKSSKKKVLPIIFASLLSLAFVVMNVFFSINFYKHFSAKKEVENYVAESRVEIQNFIYDYGYMLEEWQKIIDSPGYVFVLDKNRLVYDTNESDFMNYFDSNYTDDGIYGGRWISTYSRNFRFLVSPGKNLEYDVNGNIISNTLRLDAYDLLRADLDAVDFDEYKSTLAKLQLALDEHRVVSTTNFYIPELDESYIAFNIFCVIGFVLNVVTIVLCATRKNYPYLVVCEKSDGTVEYYNDDSVKVEGCEFCKEYYGLTTAKQNEILHKVCYKMFEIEFTQGFPLDEMFTKEQIQYRGKILETKGEIDYSKLIPDEKDAFVDIVNQRVKEIFPKSIEYKNSKRRKLGIVQLILLISTIVCGFLAIMFSLLSNGTSPFMYIFYVISFISGILTFLYGKAKIPYCKKCGSLGAVVDVEKESHQEFKRELVTRKSEIKYISDAHVSFDQDGNAYKEKIVDVTTEKITLRCPCCDYEWRRKKVQKK